MFKKTLLAASAAVLFMGTGSAFAATEAAAIVNFAPTTTPPAVFPGTSWFGGFDVTQFDTQGGTRILDSIDISLGGTWSASLDVTNNSGSAANYNIKLQGEIGIGAGSNTVLGLTNSWWFYAAGEDAKGLNTINNAQTRNFATAGTLPLTTATAGISGVSSVTTAPATGSGAFSNPFNTSALGSLYTSLQGTGVFHMTAYGANNFTVTGPNSNSLSTGTATPELAVNYTWHSAPVPEPATLALLAVGAAGFAASKRRKMAVAA